MISSIMRKALANINLGELNLDKATQEMLERLLNHIEILTKEVRQLKEENQRLRDENAELKGEKGKPDIKANKKPEKSEADIKKQEQTKRTMNKEEIARSERIKIDREDVRKLERSELPEDVEHRGYREVVIQNIKFQSDNVLYRLERMYSPSEGKFYEAKLPEGLSQQRYGNELRAFIIRQYFELRIPQEKIVEMLRSEAIVISAGEVSQIITTKHIEVFEQERKEIVVAGLQSSSYQNIDDTGGRENGVNQVITVICNPHFSSFYTNPRKDAETVAKLLSDLETRPQIAELESKAKAKTLSEYIKIIMADDAKQFHHQTTVRALCWIHEDRHYKKLNPYFQEHQKLVEEFRKDLWNYYSELKAYKAQPSEQDKDRLLLAFDALFSRTTGYIDLDHRIELTLKKKAQLLVVLDYPLVPLHNNDAEQAVREYVIKLKISNGTRSQDGTKSWDVYLSILGTCRKLGVNFYRYVLDRISNSFSMPSLAHIISTQSQPVPT